MSYGLIAIVGTGTNVGKTHVTAALSVALARRGIPVVAYKPVESGVSPEHLSDTDRLGAHEGMFHVKPPPTIQFRAPLAPVFAAALEGQSIPTLQILKNIANLRTQAHVLLELPGGAFSPFDETLHNAGLLLAIPQARLLLVAPNRLGVLHDLSASTLALRAQGTAPGAILLNDTETPDLSSPRNAADIRKRLPHAPVYAAKWMSEPDPTGVQTLCTALVDWAAETLKAPTGH